MAGCKEDTSQLAINNRIRQYEKMSKTYPQSKCTYDTMPPHIQELYKAYREYPVSMVGCPNRDKVFVLNSNCTKFKRIPKDYYPGKEFDDNEYANCMMSSGGDCEKILDMINKKRLDHTIKYNLDLCNASNSGKCGVFDVNNFIYKENKLIKYLFYGAPLILCCFCLLLMVIIIVIIL